MQWENLTERRFVILKSDMASVDARRAVMEEKDGDGRKLKRALNQGSRGE